MLVDGEQILDIVPSLKQHREYAVGLAAWRGGDALSHLALEHAAAAHHLIFVVEHLKQDLRRDVVGVVADDHKLLLSGHLGEVEFQEVGLDDAAVELRVALVQVVDALGVEFHHLQVVPVLQQELREHAHAWTHLDERQVLVFAHHERDALGYREVGEEVLS